MQLTTNYRFYQGFVDPSFVRLHVFYSATNDVVRAQYSSCYTVIVMLDENMRVYLRFSAFVVIVQCS